MKKILIFTSNRSEYGLLSTLMSEINNSPKLSLQILAAGSHFSPEYGETYKSIENDGFQIDSKVEMLLSSDTQVGAIKSLGLGMIGFADALDKLKPDVLVLLGDRYESIGIAQAALISQIPIVHIHGGEITEAAYDDSIRHAITKLSKIHFVSNEEHRNRVIQMGERPEFVFNYGAIGIDRINSLKRMSKEELSSHINFQLNKYLLVTYHPVTIDSYDENPEITIKELLKALDFHNGYQVIFTYPNPDNGGKKIIKEIERYVDKNSSNCIAMQSMGSRLYLSAMEFASAVIGNSSSGLIEAPYFKVPTVNIGKRQKGRVCGNSVISCGTSCNEIKDAISESITVRFSKICHESVNPYGGAGVSKKIVHYLEDNKITNQKTFFDINF